MRIGMGIFVGLAPDVTQRVRGIFASGAINGALYDYSNISSLNQLSTGTTPVTAVTDPVGLSLDSRLGLVLGPELVVSLANGVPVNGNGTVIATANSIQCTCTVNGNYGFAFTPSVSPASGKPYKIVVTKTTNTASKAVKFDLGGVNATDLGAAVETKAAFVANTTSTAYLAIYIAGGLVGESFTVSLVSVRLLEGNHALQATAAARPTWSNRVNLLTYSEDLTNASWTKTFSGTGVTPVVTPGQSDPDGGTTAFRVVSDRGVGNTSSDFSILRYTPTVTSTVTSSVWIKSNTGVSQTTNLNIGLGQNFVVTTEWQRLSATYSGGVTRFDIASYGPDGTTNALDVLVWHPQSNGGSTATRYQRVTTATDFDTVGFPYYLSFLGTDDSLTSATGGGGSAGFFWCGVVQPTGGAGTIRVLWTDESAAPGGYICLLSAANKFAIYAGNGVGYDTKASTATVDVGTKYLLTAWHDGTSLNVQINSAAAETVACPVVVAGSAGYTIGKANTAASQYIIGNLYSQVYFKDTGLTAAQRASVQAWVRSKAGL